MIDKTGLPIISAKALLNGFNYLQTNIKSVTAPFLTIQGEKDYVVSAKMTKWFVEKSQSEDKSCIYLDNLYHAIGAEPELPELTLKIIEWINIRLGQSDGRFKDSVK